MARLMGIFDVQQGDAWHTMVLLHWMTEADNPEDQHVPDATTYWQNPEAAPDVVGIECIERPVRLLTSVLNRQYFVRTKYNAHL